MLFGGAFGDPEAWDRPVSDLVQFHLPANAEPGRYLFVIKARREYLGESSLVTTQLEISVGSGSPDPSRWVGGCKECHTDDLQLGAVLHANEDPRSCDICHAPLGFEPDNLLAFRVHYVHFFSHRYGASKTDCQRCHLTLRSIERQSYLACLGCHLTYHGGAEVHGLYERCADIVYCHPDHNVPDLEHFDPLPPPGSGRGSEDADLRRLHASSGSIAIPYRMRSAGVVRVGVFDVRGRQVARIDDGVVRDAGEHRVRWDGRKLDGRPAASGIYFVRIETPTEVIRSRVRLIR